MSNVLHPSRRMALLMGAAALATPALATPAFAQADAPLSFAEVADVEGVRAVKKLQFAYAQYAEAQRWDEMASLFARDGAAIYPAGSATGHGPIAGLLRNVMGGGEKTPNPKRLNARFMLSPVINVAASGKTAKGRWREDAMLGVYGQSADWAIGHYENDYVLEDGVWRVAGMHYYPLVAGSAEKGWHNVSANVPITPFHYDPDLAGTPTVLGAPGRDSAAASPGALAARLDVLLDQTAVQNLQAAYGFYTTQKMWDDVADLFAADGSMEVVGQGVYVGAKSIRRGLDRFGPINLGYGEVNDHMQFNPVVTVAADGMSANIRGMELAMTGKYGGASGFGVSIYDNHCVKQGGVWKIARMRIIPRMASDYGSGWAKDLPAPTGPSADFPPDKPSAAIAKAYPDGTGPAISFPNPVRAPARKRPAKVGVSADEARRKFNIVRMVDGAENVTTAYGYFVDEFQWQNVADMFATNGWKELAGVGTFVTRARIAESMFVRYGRNNNGRGAGITLHQKVQPYVTVSPDGQRANIRLFLLQLNSSLDRDGSYLLGVYEDEVIIENGVYKIYGMDLDYAWSASYPGGWAKLRPASNAPPPKIPPAAYDKFPPDAPLRTTTAPYPETEVPAFHYNNPVSGRPPAQFLPWSDGLHRA